METTKRKVSQPDPNTEDGATGPEQGRADRQKIQTSESQSDEQRIPSCHTKTSTDVIVLHTEQQRAAAEVRADAHEKNGMHASTAQCDDIQSFSEMTFENCTRFDIIVDASMWSILMDGERLHNDAYTKFKGMDKSHKKVYVINKCEEDFEHLFSQIPRNIRNRMDVEVHDGKNKSGHSVDSTGMTGGTGSESIITGTNNGQQQVVSIPIHVNITDDCQIKMVKGQSEIQKRITSGTVDAGETENDDPNKVELKISPPSGKEDRYISIIDSGKGKLKSEIENVKEVDLKKGSIIITLTVSEGHIVTDEWIRSILRILFDAILGTCAAEGEIFNVTVKRHQLCTLQLGPKVHENCVTKFEHQKEQQMLNLKVKNLEEELKTLKAERASVSEQNEDYQMSESKPDETDNDLLTESLEGNVGRVKKILSQKSVNIESQGQFGRTPVMMAVQNGHIGVVKELIKAGCELLLFDNNGNNILHIACLSGSLDMAKYIMSLKIIDKDSRGESGVTPVMMAALKGYKDIFDFLVGEGCSLRKVNAFGDNILHLACSGGNVGIAKYILSQGIAGVNSTGQYRETAMMKAVQKNRVEMVSFLVGKGCDLNCLDDDGNNILHLACTGGCVDIVKIIVSQGKVDQEGRGKYGLTPVMMAAENGHFEVFKFLVERGCKLSIQDERYFNIFHLAAIGGNVKIVEHLLEKNVPGTEDTNMFNMTPVQIAESKDLIPIINLIASEA